ncbi:hypothetical protein [Mycobacterium genavense]|uniref:hypothetical protein n=1 Tax=Mycobacterium genavense TaxID=36812 RepID=UPI001FE1DDDA|nr:hypothetical protein [Mycobacterium genavense]
MVEAANQATELYGHACGGAPPHYGTLRVKVDLEELLTDWYGTEAALVFNSGYLANVGAITVLLGAADLAFPDSEATCRCTTASGCRAPVRGTSRTTTLIRWSAT